MVPVGLVTWSKSTVHGKGVFAARSIRKGKCFEICPCKTLCNMPKTELVDYVFKRPGGGYLLAFGYCSLYNHSDTPSAVWSVEPDKKNPGEWVIELTARRDIDKGEEITISYGKGYWLSRCNDGK